MKTPILTFVLLFASSSTFATPSKPVHPTSFFNTGFVTNLDFRDKKGKKHCKKRGGKKCKKIKHVKLDDLHHDILKGLVKHDHKMKRHHSRLPSISHHVGGKVKGPKKDYHQVPEPTMIALFMIGLLSIGMFRRKSTKQKV